MWHNEVLANSTAVIILPYRNKCIKLTGYTQCYVSITSQQSWKKSYMGDTIKSKQ